MCEQIFSNMNYIKSKYCSRLTEESLQSCVTITLSSSVPDVEKLSGDVHFLKRDLCQFGMTLTPDLRWTRRRLRSLQAERLHDGPQALLLSCYSAMQTTPSISLI